MNPEIWRKLGLKDDEFQMIVNILGREPNFVELSMYSVMWSEHCSYKHSKETLRLFPTTGRRVLQGPGENAGIVDIGDNIGICFKMESHNHPSAIEPYQGAATGVGGIIRDIFTMGARPVALLNSLRFGPLKDNKNRHLFRGVVAGISGYGNCIGIPTVGGEIYFDSCYDRNPLVNVMCAGVIDKNKIKLGRATGLGNLVILVGARTGRDGIHGVTFASEELSQSSEEKRPSVQVGDPFLEKLLLEACLELIENGDIVGIQDLGGAGLTCATSETASRAKTGMEINLDKVPLREEGMEAYEIMISESQERMLLIVAPEKEQRVHEVFHRWGLDSVTIGKVTSDGILRVFMKGKVVAEVPARSLADEGPVYHPEAQKPKYLQEVSLLDLTEIPDLTDANRVLLKLLSSPSLSSKEWVYSQYDHMVRTCTVVLPGSDSAVLRIRGTKKGIALTTDCNSRYVYLNPQEGGKIAVAEAARNLVCSGAEPLAVTDCLNFGNPEKPEIFWQFRKAVEGIAEACRYLDIPVVSGNVSFYNEANGAAIYPTPTIGMVGLLEDLDFRCTQDFKKEGDIIVLLGDTYEELGGSEYLSELFGLVKGNSPAIDLDKEKSLQKLVLSAIRKGMISSAHDLSEGGLALALAECCIGGNLGAKINLNSMGLRKDSVLFGESQSRIVLSISPDKFDYFKQEAENSSVTYKVIGLVIGNRLSIDLDGKNLIDLAVEEISQAWREVLGCYMR